MKKVLLGAGVAMFIALAPGTALAQDCGLDVDSCDEGGGGLGGVSGGGGGVVPGKGGTVTPAPTPAPTATTLIGFDTIGQKLSTYTESGYVFQLESGTIYGGNGAYGTRGLYVLGEGAAAYVPGPANIMSAVRSDGGLFSVDSLFNPLASSSGLNTLVLTGFVNGVQTATSTLTSDAIGFGFPTPSGLTGSFDRVLFNFSTTSSSNMFDRLTVTAQPAATAVPEPAAWAMMILGMAAIGGAMRYRRRSAKVVFG